jgi:uridine phosphorylase
LTVYRELDPAAHRRMLGITEDGLPDVLVIFGELAVERAAKRMADHLEEPEYLPRWGGYLANFRGRRVALHAAFGGAMAAHYVHIWCGAGVKNVLQLGWFGALQHGMDAGDVVVPSHAAREEGVSDWYLPKGVLADATPELASAVSSSIRSIGVAVNQGPLFTTPSMLAESRDVVSDWSRHGWLGVDMETASTFAVAKHFEARRVAALVLIDDLVGEKNSLAEVATTQALGPLLREREKQVLYAALEAVTS